MIEPKNSNFKSTPKRREIQPEGLQLFLLYLRFSVEIFGLFLYTLYTFALFVFRQFVPADPKSLKNEIILVTGGANGIGREICLGLGKLESNLIIISWDVDPEANEILIKELKAHGVKKAYGFTVDVSNQKEVEVTAQKIRQEIGNVTMLFNNAGISGPKGNGWEVSPEGVEKVYQINAISHFYTIKEFLPSMIEKSHGHVIETCSVFGFFYSKYGSPYIASKHAVKGYVESIKEDLRNLKGKPDVKFTLVYPHNTITNMTRNINFQAGKYPFLMPHMTPAFVASKVIEGVLRNYEHIYVPGDMRFVAMFLQMLPPQVVRRLTDIVDIQTDIQK